MAREPWKCPYDGCRQECSRKSNQQRHIKRFHNGIGMPVRQKSTPYGHHLSETPNKDPKLSAFNTQQPNQTYREEQDFVNVIYQDFKKTKEKIDKIQEMKNFLHGSRNVPDIFNGAYQAIFPPMAHNNLNTTVTSDPPVGFRTHICKNCLTAPIEPVLLSDFELTGPIAFKVNHRCRHEDLEYAKRLADKFPNIVITTRENELSNRVVHYLAETVRNAVGLGGQVCLGAYEPPLPYVFASKEDDGICSKYAKPWIEGAYINLEKLDSSHWAYRALNNNNGSKKTAISNNELLDFLSLARSTFAAFQAKIDRRTRRFYLYVTGDK